MILRDYQLAGIKQAEDFFAVAPRGRKLLLQCPTGTGKSFIELALLKSGRFLVTPSLEIVRDLLTKKGESDLPDSDEKLARLGQSHGIWTPIRLRNELVKGTVTQPSGIICDECFVAGTLVDGKPIEEWDVGETTSMGRVAVRYSSTAPPSLYEVQVGERRLVCTGNHPFLTSEGWKNADALDDDSFVLCDMSRGLLGEQESISEVPPRIAGSVRAELQRLSLRTEHGPDKSEALLGTHDGSQPHAPTGDSGQGIDDPTGNWPQAALARGQWETFAEAPEDVRGPIAGVLTGVRGPHGRRTWATLPLQDRPSRPDNPLGDRSGRQVAQYAGSAGTGCPQDRVLSWRRVDSVTVHQRGGTGEFERLCPNGRVYNLHIERSHVYWAEGVLVHNCHHDESDSWQEFGALAGDPPAVGFTATGYRGTPKSTVKFRERWGPAKVLLSYRDAVARGFASHPQLSVEPLLDDDLIEVKDGEFIVKSANEAIGSRVGDACRLIQGYYNGSFDKATMLAVPSTECVGYFLERLDALGVPAVGVTADSSRSDRQTAFRACVERSALLVQIRVVSEGVDLPIRRLIDLSPTMSPVRWVQQFGRITRPGGEPEYVCCCRNLFRHCYLLDGLVPPEIIATEATLFGSVSARSAGRSIGLEAVGRFKAAEVPYAGGVKGWLYCLSEVRDGVVTEFAIITHPSYPEPVVARRQRKSGQFGPKWERCDRVPDIDRGFSSVPGSPVTSKQADWWKRSAANYGLDPEAEVNRKSFVALPVLSNLRVKFK
jgi:hypothetical protein